MRIPVRYQVWLIGCCCCLFLAACAKRDAAHLAEATPPANSPALTRSLEPAVPEPVNRIFQRSCQSCHGPDGHGILAIAPDLRKAKSRSPEQWKQFLSDPQSGHPGAELAPPTWLSESEIAVMADYLTNLTLLNPPVTEPTPQARQTGKQGKVAR